MAGENTETEGPQSLSEAFKEANEKPKSVLWLVATLAGLFAWGLVHFLGRTEPNGCAMTYMYEYPMYEPVVPDLPEDVRARFPKYGLYAYGEGQFVDVRITFVFYHVT